MFKELPVVSGKKIILLLQSFNYRVVRQRGIHVRMEKVTEAGVHKITIPNHNPVAKGTLNDILNKVSIWNQISKEKLIKRVK